MSLFQTLKPRPKNSTSGGTCLLLDTSGSMDEYVFSKEEEEQRRIELLFKAVRDTPECQGLTAYEFNTHCRVLEVIPSEEEAVNFVSAGGTAMDNAFLTVKAAGFYNAILVTDGCPDSESKALAAAAGMKLGIIYIGNPPCPGFLERLAAATDGTFAIADMRDLKQLEDAMIRALPAPESNDPPKGGGTIAL